MKHPCLEATLSGSKEKPDYDQDRQSPQDDAPSAASTAPAPVESKVKALWSIGLKTAKGFGSVMKMFAPAPKEEPKEEEPAASVPAAKLAPVKVGFGSVSLTDI